MPKGERLSRTRESAIAALLTQPSIADAARTAGIGERTLRGWLKLPAFAAAYRQARRELVDGAIGRIQGAAGQAVDTLLAVAKTGAKDGDRVRAAVALLDHALRGLTEADTLHGGPEPGNVLPMGTADVVQLLSERLRQLDAAEVPAADKSRLTATLTDSLLRAIGVDVLDKRLEAVQNVLMSRKDKDER